jgi:hypothetical protein
MSDKVRLKTLRQASRTSRPPCRLGALYKQYVVSRTRSRIEDRRAFSIISRKYFSLYLLRLFTVHALERRVLKIVTTLKLYISNCTNSAVKMKIFPKFYKHIMYVTFPPSLPFPMTVNVITRGQSCSWLYRSQTLRA